MKYNYTQNRNDYLTPMELVNRALKEKHKDKYWHDYILNNPQVKIEWLRKGYSFINPDDNKPMGIFKNALALVYFNKK